MFKELINPTQTLVSLPLEDLWSKRIWGLNVHKRPQKTFLGTPLYVSELLLNMFIMHAGTRVSVPRVHLGRHTHPRAQSLMVADRQINNSS